MFVVFMFIVLMLCFYILLICKLIACLQILSYPSHILLQRCHHHSGMRHCVYLDLQARKSVLPCWWARLCMDYAYMYTYASLIALSSIVPDSFSPFTFTLLLLWFWTHWAMGTSNTNTYTHYTARQFSCAHHICSFHM